MHAHLLLGIAAGVALWASADVAAQSQPDKATTGSTSKSAAAPVKAQKTNAGSAQQQDGVDPKAVKDQAKAKTQVPTAVRDAPVKIDGGTGCHHWKDEDA